MQHAENPRIPCSRARGWRFSAGAVAQLVLLERGDILHAVNHTAAELHELRTFTGPPLWVSDFTYVSSWAGMVYVAFVIDVFARVQQVP